MVKLTQYQAIELALITLRKGGYNINDKVYKSLTKERALLERNDKDNIEEYH